MVVLGQFCYNITKRIAQLAAEQSVYRRQKAGEETWQAERRTRCTRAFGYAFAGNFYLHPPGKKYEDPLLRWRALVVIAGLDPGTFRSRSGASVLGCSGW